MKRKQRLTWAIALATVLPLGASAAPARSAALTDSVRRGESDQAQIKTQVQRATEDLTAIIAELDRNGIAGDDVKMLVRIRDVLGDLTARDMGTVISLLQQARNGADATRARGDLTQAVVGQDQIIVKLRQVLLEYKRQQDLYELSLRFTELATRQNANYKQVQGIFRALGPNATADRLNDSQRESRTLQAGDQDAIRDEARMLIDKLHQIIAETDPQTAERLTKSLEEAKRGRLEESLADASTSLKDTKLGNAASAENRARNGLYALASLVAPPEDSATKLRKAAAQLDKAIAEEKVVIGQTAALATDRGQHDQATFQESYYVVVDRQSDNTELVDRLEKSIDVLAPEAAATLDVGKKAMYEAWSAIRDFHRDPAAEREKVALAKLEEARKLLETQIAKADADKPTGDAIQQTKELKEKVASLRAEQEKLNAQTKAAQPRDGTKLAKTEATAAQTARDLQIEAAPQSMKAADEIAAAAKEMDRSREDLDKGATAEASSPQKSAIDHLARAERQLDEQLAKLEQDQKDLAKLEDAREKVAKLIADQGHVANDTAKEAGKQEGQKQTPKPDDAKANADANKNLAQKESDVGKKTDEARQSLPESAKAAAAPLDNARQKMSDAKNTLDQNKTKDAQPPEDGAIADLNKAKDAIDQKMEELQKELGQQQDNASKLDDLAKQLQQAQQNLNNAQQGMQQSPAEKLAEQQKQIAQQLQDAQKQKPGDQNLQKAQKSADQAAQDLQDNKTDKAVSEMKDVQTAIQKSEQAQQTSQPGKEGEQKPQDGKPSDASKSDQANAQKPGEKGEKGEGKPGEKGEPGKGDQPGQGQPAQANGQKPSDKPGAPGQGGQQGKQGGQGGTPGQSMTGISQQQAAVQQAAEQLAAAQSQQQMQQAAEQLGQVANKVTNAAANDQGALPSGAQQALQQAQKALNEATAQAQANNKPSAQAQAQSAQAAISQAQAAVDMARQGMQPGQLADASSPPPSQSGEPSSPSKGAPGAPSPSPSQGKENTPGQLGTGDRKDVHGGDTQANGARGNVTGNSTYLSLPARDRQAIQQGQKEKYPEEYGPAIEQYLRNLSDQEK